MSSASGPVGHAVASAMFDLTILPESLVESIGKMGGTKIIRKIQTLRKVFPLRPNLIPENITIPKTGARFRKLVYFPDKELKVRVVAVLDY